MTTEPFRGSLAVAEGGVTKGRLRGPEFVPLYRGIHVGASTTVDAVVRARALALRAGDGAVIAGPLAALVLDAECPWDDAEVVVRGNRRFGHEDATMHRWHLERWEIVREGGVALTSAARTAFDLARRDAPLADRLAAVDALAHRQLFGVPALDEVADEHPGLRGCVAAREVFALVDPRAESLMESRAGVALQVVRVLLRGLTSPPIPPIVTSLWKAVRDIDATVTFVRCDRRKDPPVEPTGRPPAQPALAREARLAGVTRSARNRPV